MKIKAKDNRFNASVLKIHWFCIGILVVLAMMKGVSFVEEYSEKIRLMNDKHIIALNGFDVKK